MNSALIKITVTYVYLWTKVLNTSLTSNTTLNKFLWNQESHNIIEILDHEN